MDFLYNWMDEMGPDVARFLAAKNCEWCYGTGWDVAEMIDMDGGYTVDTPCGCIYQRIAHMEYYEHPEASADYDSNPYEVGTQEYIDWIPF